MKKLLLFFSLILFAKSWSQVGINTTNPSAQLEIKSTNPAAPNNLDGVLIPKVNTFATGMTAAQQSMLVYLTTTVGTNTPGFYYWDNPTTTWIPILTSGKTGTLDQAYDSGGIGAGRTITADNGAVLINGTDGLVSTGTFNSGAIVPSGSGTRMVWNPRRAAFRAGIAANANWDDVNMGNGSVAFGSDNKASGNNSSAFGGSGVASGTFSTVLGAVGIANGYASIAGGFGSETNGLGAIALGWFCRATNQGSIAIGAGSTANGLNAAALGYNGTANGAHSFVLGGSNTASSYAETVIGHGATNYTTSTNGETQFGVANLTDRLFVVGNGYDVNLNGIFEAAERKDALVILKNGNTGIGTSTPQAKLEVNGSFKITDGNQGAGKVLVSDANGLATWGNNPSSGWALTGNSGTNSTNYLGTNDNQTLGIRTNGIERARILNDGKAIFGTAMTSDAFSGLSKFEIGSNDADNDFTLRHSGTDIPVFNILRSRGVMKTPTNVQNGDEIGSMRFWGYVNGSATGFDNYAPAGRLVSAVENVSGNLLNAGIRIVGSGMNNGIYVSSGGRVGIGTTGPSAGLHLSGSLRLDTGTQGAGKVLTSLDGLGNTEWRVPSTIASGTLDEAYDFGGAGNGRTITADNGAVLINGTDGLVATGILNSGALMPTGNGIRMVWNPRKAAFRFGQAVTTSWDDANTGSHSGAFGFDTMASGTVAMAFGTNTRATGYAATVFGQAGIASGVASVAFNSSNEAIGTHSAAFNLDTKATGYGSSSFGTITAATGNFSLVAGSNNNAASFGETVIGTASTSYTPTTNGAMQFRTANLSDRLLVVGNGYDSNNNLTIEDSERSDAMVVLKNGNTGIGSSTPQEKLHIVGKVRIADGTQAAGRILVSDANGTGTWQTNSATNAWGLAGNASTNPATNFIGTTDAQPLVVRTNNAERMRVMANGFIGMGTNDPDRELEVYGAGVQYARITSSGTSDVGIEFRRTGTASDWQMRNDAGIMLLGQSNDDMVTVTDVFRVGGSSVTPALDNFVQLGQNALRWVSVHATNGVIQTSDANDKQQMISLENGLDKIKALRPISFQWKDSKIDNHSTHLGFVAQEVQKVLPEIVVDADWKEGAEGQGRTWEKTERLGMKYSEVIPVLVKAVQEQQTLIEAQNKTIAEMMQRLEKLENKK